MNIAELTPAGELTAEELGRVHLVGIGGVGMSGLARLLLTRGIAVSGSELREWPALAALRALGGTIHMQHEVTNLDGVDTVVYSTAIPADHLELAEARARGLRLMHRSEALAAAMTGRRAVAVAGTHGKTTTTSMATLIFQHAGLDPSFVIGGEISEVGSNAHHGSGEYFIVEADESDRSFLLYRPHVAIVTNIDADHLNTYGDLAGLQEAFVEFGGLVEADGFVVTCVDDPGGRRLAELLRATGATVHTYGEAPDADLRLTEVRSSVTGVRYLAALDGESLGEVSLPTPGRHLGLNSAAAVLTSVRLGIAPATAIEALATFPGVRRRFELKGVECGVRVYDEYAYHPTSMTAATSTLREVAGDGRLIVVFQPYRVYRTHDLEAEIAAALALADDVVVMEVFGPGEVREPGQGGLALTAAIDLPADRKVFLPSWE
jgi:UDP-N-acetylmuramate--alanine ligase